MTFQIVAGVAAVLYTLPVWWFLVRPRWPWDWKGNRKHIDIPPGPRRPDWKDFDDY